MADTFFGAGSQIWPALPAPLFGYVPPVAASRSPMIGNVTPVEPVQSMTGSWPGVAAASGTSGSAAPMAPDVMGGITPQALLTAVAMRRGQPMGPSSDQDIEDFISDALDVLPGANDVEIRCDGGRATLTGSVAHKRLKRDAGEIAWAIPTVHDVQNNITIAARRRSRAQLRETEAGSSGGSGASRKQA